MHLNRRDFLKAAGAALAAGLLPTTPAAARTEPTRPNIVLCMADDQGWGDVAYNGHPALKTPNLDAMSRSGLRFDRFYAAAPVCSPTRGSVMTGRHPNRFGCFSWGRTLRPQEVTVAEALRAVGYATGHFGKWHLGSVRRGSPVNPGAGGFDTWLSAPNFYDNDPILSREGAAVQMEGESSMIAADAAIDFIRRHAKGPRPFLAVVWFGSPHNPHRAAEQDRALYTDQPEKFRDFYGEITGLDRAVGKLRNELADLGIKDNTLFWYCSDNGGLPNLGRTGGRGHKGDIYEGGLRVPAIIEWPARIKQPRTTNVPCVTSDIYPTLLDLVGTKPATQPILDGIPLTPLIDGNMQSRPKPIGFWEHPAGGIRTPSAEWMADLLKAQQGGDMLGDLSRLRLDAAQIDEQYPLDEFPGHSAWLDWPWKLHRMERPDGRTTLELYNLAEDPLEKDDRAISELRRAERMNDELETWLLSVVKSLNGEDYK